MNSILLEKWEPLLNAEKVQPIESDYKAKVTAQLLENQENFLKEAATTTTSNVSTYDPVLINLVRRMAPKLIAYDVCGVQPMTLPTGSIFAMRSRYTNALGNEALFDEANTAFSGTGTHESQDPWAVDNPTTPGVIEGYKTGTGKATADGEVDAWNSMSMTVEKVTVTAKTRQLRADYSLELAQDLRAVHGLDAESELTNILSMELINEINREVVRTLISVAKPGAQFATTPGILDVNADTDGRWSAEKFKGMMYAIERDANAIAYETRAGKGNFIITSSNVASALAMAGVLDYAPAINNNLEVDVTGTTYAGNMGRYKVYVDPFLATDGYVIGYKGSNAWDAGFYYAPYIPLQLVRATSVDSFTPALGFKTRYGMVANPFTSLNANQNIYFRKVKVTNLM